MLKKTKRQMSNIFYFLFLFLLMTLSCSSIGEKLTSPDQEKAIKAAKKILNDIKNTKILDKDIPYFIKALKNENKIIVDAAEKALVSLGEKSVLPLISVLKDTISLDDALKIACPFNIEYIHLTKYAIESPYCSMGRVIAQAQLDNALLLYAKTPSPHYNSPESNDMLDNILAKIAETDIYTYLELDNQPFYQKEKKWNIPNRDIHINRKLSAIKIFSYEPDLASYLLMDLKTIYYSQGYYYPRYLKEYTNYLFDDKGECSIHLIDLFQKDKSISRLLSSIILEVAEVDTNKANSILKKVLKDINSMDDYDKEKNLIELIPNLAKIDTALAIELTNLIKYDKRRNYAFSEIEINSADYDTSKVLKIINNIADGRDDMLIRYTMCLAKNDLKRALNIAKLIQDEKERINLINAAILQNEISNVTADIRYDHIYDTILDLSNEFLNPLLNIVKNNQESNTIRLRVVHLLSKFKQREVLDTFISLLFDKEVVFLHSAILHGLTYFKTCSFINDYIPKLLEFVKSDKDIDITRNAIIAIGNVGNSQAVNEIAKFLNHEMLYKDAIFTLGKLKAINFLLTIYNNSKHKSEIEKVLYIYGSKNKKFKLIGLIFNKSVYDYEYPDDMIDLLFEKGYICTSAESVNDAKNKGCDIYLFADGGINRSNYVTYTTDQGSYISLYGETHWASYIIKTMDGKELWKMNVSGYGSPFDREGYDASVVQSTITREARFRLSDNFSDKLQKLGNNIPINYEIK